MRILNVCTDMDGVTNDWHSGYIEYAKKKGFVLDPSNDRSCYDMHDWFTNMSEEQFHNSVSEFNGSPDAMNIPLLNDVERYISKIKDDGHNLFALTACGDSEDQKFFRNQLIEKRFAEIFDEVHIIGLGDCKRAHLELLSPDVYIEDSLHHANTALEIGVPHVLLVETTHNRGHDHHRYVCGKKDTWFEITSYIKEVALT